MRDSEEPTPLDPPTTIVGTVQDATGILTGGTFSAPPVEYSFGITAPVVATVDIEATFTEVVPGSVNATVGEDDSVVVAMSVKADLHIKVGTFMTADCTASPISLRLNSTVPFDRETSRVTLRDPDFSVPAVAAATSCPNIIRDEVNERLVGGGHSLELIMEGTVPPVVGIGEPTTTTLSVEPEVSRAGQEVTMTAEVASVEGEDEPTGIVEFLNGASVLGNAPLVGGVATFATSSLGVGEHQLRARYLGDGELHSRSLSEVAPYLVAAVPGVDIDMVDTVLYGGRSRVADVVITNPEEFGAPVLNARIDLSLARAHTQNLFDSTKILVEWLNGGTWEPIPLTYDFGNRRATASVGPATGFSVATGAKASIRLRITMPQPTTLPSPTSCGISTAPCPGPWDLMARVVEVDGNGDVLGELAEEVHRFMLIEQTRRAVSLTFAGGAPRPHTVRQGYLVELFTVAAPTIGGVAPTGEAEIYVDGRLTPARRPSDPFDQGYTDRITWGPAANLTAQIVLPPDFEEGAHQITIRYLGDALFLPAEATTTFTVLPANGVSFVCRAPNLTGQHEYGANVTFEADAPPTAIAGSTVELDLGAVHYTTSRLGTLNVWPSLNDNLTATAGEGTLAGISFTLGKEGSGTATTLTRTGGTAMAASPDPAGEAEVDQTLTFGGPTASAVVEGEPGEVVPITLDEIKLDFRLSSPPLPVPHTCTPVDGPMVLGEVEIAGTTVSVDPEGRVREITDEVTVEAETFPADAAGTVTFSSDLDGELGSDTVSDGSASFSTDELSPGVHQVTASFNATDPEVPDTVSAPVTVEVQYSPRTGTQAFVIAARTDYTGEAAKDDVVADAGAIGAGRTKTAYLSELSRSDEYLAHVVNEMYLDTLGREGDAGGVEFWIGRLRVGWSVARVAASFYSSDEYYQRVGGTDEAWVGDLYEVLLGRAPDTSGQAFWVGRIAAQGRDQVALTFFQTPESARARVVALYQQFLGRAPSPADRDFWAARVIARGDLILAVELTLSPEYANRAATRFPLV